MHISPGGPVSMGLPCIAIRKPALPSLAMFQSRSAGNSRNAIWMRKKRPRSLLSRKTSIGMSYRQRGIHIGSQTRLLWGTDPQVRGKTRRAVTTEWNEGNELECIARAKVAHSDRSCVLNPELLRRHVGATGIDYTPEQRAVIKQ